MDIFPPVTLIFGISIRTFSLLIGLGMIASGFSAWRMLRAHASIRHLVDIGLGALIGGLVLARVVHVAFQWEYFSAHSDEIARLNAGGLDWHGALIGGLAGGWAVAKWRRVSYLAVLDGCALALPILTAFTWYACASVITAHCGYGQEITTLAAVPSWAASESRDVFGIMAPRWNTQHFGLIWSVCVAGLVWWLQWRQRLAGRRFWLSLSLVSAGMFVIGFWRGDAVPFVRGLRADQWLDGIILALGIAGMLASSSRAAEIAGEPERL